MTTPHGHTKIVSATPKRTRVRVSAKRRTPREIARIAEALEKLPFVHRIRENIGTGSLVIEHSPGSLDKIRKVLIDLGIIFGSTTDSGLFGGESEKGIVSGLAGAVSDLNKRIGSAAGGIFDLRTVVPVGLGVLAVVQLLRKGWQIEAAPWYILAYAAVHSFRELHGSTESQPFSQGATPPL